MKRHQHKGMQWFATVAAAMLLMTGCTASDSGRDSAVEPEGETVIAPFDHLVAAGVEDSHHATPVLTRWDRAGERGVLHRMVLGADGEMPIASSSGKTLRDRP